MKTNNTCKKNSKLYSILPYAAAVAFMVMLLLCARETGAAQLTPSFSSTDGSACADISDGSYWTSEKFAPGTDITISSDENIDALYIQWEEVPGEWTLKVNGTDYTFGKDGFLHEYVKLPESAASVTVAAVDSTLNIAEIYALSPGELPSFVQKWEPSYDEADILFLSTHADDECLFFGGVIPNYTDKSNVRVQVAYFTDLFQTEPYRNHEILNGLWTMGVTHYPQLGEFYDYYSESYEEAAAQYDYDSSLEYVVRTIRRFKPQVLIGQDIINGEYGHGGHLWSSKMIADAIEISDDSGQYPESASKYGVWQVPKTYLHLYPEGQIELDARVPLASLGGKTALQAAKDAYLQHESQQWCWFYVDDGYDEYGNPNGYEYSCTKYGLYASNVGADFTGTDILDNIVTYDDQKKAAAVPETTEAVTDAVQEAAGQEAAIPEKVVDPSNESAVPGGKNTTALTILIVLAVILVLVIAGILAVSKIRAAAKSKERELRRRSGNPAERTANRRPSESGVYDQRRPERSTTDIRRPAQSSQGMRSSAQRNANTRSNVQRSTGMRTQARAMQETRTQSTSGSRPADRDGRAGSSRRNTDRGRY
ncbi:MAG: PIG-L family deacetylase [Parasporobacterium sp.]|nr:PIG-L family deacetylase [Parasporobacterium sp.]